MAPTKNKKKAFLRRIFVLFLGCFLTLAALELGLAIAGLLIPAPAPQAGREADILCLGNSHTAGLGAPQGESYCDWLQRMLHESAGRPIRVQNLGVAAANSADILDSLVENLNHTNPKIVLLMVGEPNYWNLRGFRHSDPNSLIQLAGRILFETKTFRLWRQLAKPDPSDSLEEAYYWLTRILRPTPLESAPLSESDRRVAKRHLTKAMDHKNLPSVFNFSLALARLAVLGGNLDDAERWYLTSISQTDGFPYDAFLDLESSGHPKLRTIASQISLAKADPDALEIVRAVRSQEPLGNIPRLPQGLFEARKFFPAMTSLMRAGWVHERLTTPFAVRSMHARETTKTIEAIERYLKIYPCCNSGGVWSLLSRLRSHQNPDLAARAQEAWNQLAPLRSGRALPSSSPSNASIENWLREDLAAIVEKVRSAGAIPVFMTYPPIRGSLNRRAPDSTLFATAQLTATPILDTYQQLLPSLSARPDQYYSQSLRSEDHLNSQGYKLVASGLLKFLEEKNLLVHINRQP